MPIGPIESLFVVTVAGGTHPNYIDGTGIEARFNEPTAIAFGPSGELFVTEAASGRLRCLDAYGNVSTYGVLGGEPLDYQVNPTFFSVEVALARLDVQVEHDEGRPEHRAESPRDRLSWFESEGLAISRAGVIAVSDSFDDRIWLATRGGLATWLSGATHPTIEVARDGAITLLDVDGSRHFRSFPDARQAQQWRDGPPHEARFAHPQGLAYMPDGDLMVADTGNGRLRRVRADGSTETIAYDFKAPSGIAVGPEGHLYVSDAQSHTICVVLPSGQVQILAGGEAGFKDGHGEAAQFCQPRGLALDHAGGLWVADAGNHAIRYISPEGQVVTVAGRGEAGFNDGPAQQASFSRPWGVMSHPAGGVLVADRDNHRIRWVLSGKRVSLSVGDDTLLYTAELAQGQRLERPAPPVRLQEWDDLLDLEIRSVVKDYGRDRLRIYFPKSFIEIEGQGSHARPDALPYFKPPNNSGDFYFLPHGFVGKTIASLLLDGSEEDSHVYIRFTDGTEAFIEPYMGGRLKVIKTDAESDFDPYEVD